MMSPSTLIVSVSSLCISPNDEAFAIGGLLMLCALAPYPMVRTRRAVINFMICAISVFNVRGNRFSGLQIYHFYFVQDYLLFKFA